MATIAEAIRSVVAVAHGVVSGPAGGLTVTVRHARVRRDKPDGYGQPTFDEPVAREAIYVERETMRLDSRGNEVASRSRATFLQPIELDREDRFILPDGVRPVVAIDAHRDENGVVMSTVFFGPAGGTG